VQLGVFVLAALIGVGSALGLVLRRNPIHGALFLVVNLGSVAVLYLTLGAQFLAAAQVIVYAGAIMVLFVFAIMVLIPGKEETGPDPRRAVRLLAIPFGALLLLEVLLMVIARPAPPGGRARAAGGVQAIGRLLFTDYLFAFELTSVLLLAALVGVLALAKRGAGGGAAAGAPGGGIRGALDAGGQGAGAGSSRPDGAGTRHGERVT
jgi:NADH-quinone oxidoreductase subunit J